MTIDITNCIKINIADSCAVSNLLSATLLFTRVEGDHFVFSITKYVEYECLHKQRSVHSPQDEEIKRRLSKHQQKNKFTAHNLSIGDLQDDVLLRHSRQLGIGELSSIAFSKKINQPFLTDDQKARKIAQLILGTGNVQTTPQIVGWLFYSGILTDGDLDELIKEHNTFNRPLEKHFRIVYEEAMRLRYCN
jgi:predicted nucleic acid-binding protein